MQRWRRPSKTWLRLGIHRFMSVSLASSDALDCHMEGEDCGEYNADPGFFGAPLVGVCMYFCVLSDTRHLSRERSKN